MAKGNGKRPGSYTVVYSPDGEKSIRCHVDDIPGGWVRTDPKVAAENEKKAKEAEKAEKEAAKKAKEDSKKDGK